MKRIAWILVGILLLAGMVLLVVKRTREKNDAPTLEATPVAVRVAPVIKGRVDQTQHNLGTVIGGEEALVAPRIMAQVLEVKVREGDPVKRGQALASLDPRELQDAVDQARAGVAAAEEAAAAAETAALAQRDATARDKQLFEAKALAQEQWDWSQSRLAAAEARATATAAGVTVAHEREDQAATRLGYATLRAPFDGVVSARLKDPGSLALPGQPVLKLVRDGGVRVRVQVAAEIFTSLKVGQPVHLTAGTLGVDAEVSRVVPALGKNHLAAFEVDLDSPPPGFVSGAPVGVDLTLSGAEGLVVPTDALLEGQKGAFAFVVDEGVTRQVQLKVMGRSLVAAAVQGAIQAGDQVIVARPSRLMTLSDGARVHIIPADDAANER